MTQQEIENRQEDLWDYICQQIGFNKEGKELQQAIRRFVKAEKKKSHREGMQHQNQLKLL